MTKEGGCYFNEIMLNYLALISWKSDAQAQNFKEKGRILS